MLSALIKTDSYAYENETRIVYFENSIENDQNKKDQYELKSILGQKYIRSYIEFSKIELNEILKSIVVSPLTRNIPIKDNLYQEVLGLFLKNNGDFDIEVKVSKHKCRW